MFCTLVFLVVTVWIFRLWRQIMVHSQRLEVFTTTTTSFDVAVVGGRSGHNGMNGIGVESPWITDHNNNVMRSPEAKRVRPWLSNDPSNWTREINEALLREMNDGGRFFPATNEAAGNFKRESHKSFVARMSDWRSRMRTLSARVRPHFALSPRYLQIVPGTDVAFRTAIRISRDMFVLPFLVPLQHYAGDVIGHIVACEPKCRCSQMERTKIV